MKLAKFLLVLSAVEKGSARVVKTDEAGEINRLTKYVAENPWPFLAMDNDHGLVAPGAPVAVPVAAPVAVPVATPVAVPVAAPVADPVAAPVAAAPTMLGSNDGFMNNAAATYMITKDPMLTMMAQQKQQAQGAPAQEPANSAISYMAANSGDPMMSLGLTNNPSVYLASQNENPTLALAAANLNNPMATYMITKDPMLTMMAQQGQQAQGAPVQEPANSAISYIAANSGDPMMSLGLTNNPAVYLASQNENPTLALAAANLNNPMATYMITKDPMLTMMAQQKQQANGEPAQRFEPANSPISYIAANSGDPMMSLGLTNDPSVYMASQNENPTLALAASNLNNPAATYMLTKDPLLTMMAQQKQQASGEPAQPFFPTEPQPANSPLSYLAANSGDPMMSLGLTNNPAVYLASQNENPTLALAAANMNNPMATYMLTKDPVLTMMAQQGQQGQQAAPRPARPLNPMTTLALSQVKNLTPSLAYSVTGDPNMIMHGQWDNQNLALANAMGGNSPVSTNPTMDLLAAHTLTDPTTSYALTGNPLIAHAIAAGKGKQIAGLMAGQAGNPMLTYMMTKDPKLAYLSTQRNPLLSYTALQHSPAMAAFATNNPMMFLMNQ